MPPIGGETCSQSAPLPLAWRTAMCRKCSICRAASRAISTPRQSQKPLRSNDVTIDADTTPLALTCQLYLYIFNPASSIPSSILAMILSSIPANRTIRRHLALARLFPDKVESAAYYYCSHITGRKALHVCGCAMIGQPQHYLRANNGIRDNPE